DPDRHLGDGRLGDPLLREERLSRGAARRDAAAAAQVLEHSRSPDRNLGGARQMIFTSARKLASLLAARKVSAVEVVSAFIAQIERVNPKLNAIVTFLPEQALKAAKAIDRKKQKTLFGGLPIAYKDNVQTKGIRTTFGSPIYKDNVPNEDHLLVERLSAAGAI